MKAIHTKSTVLAVLSLALVTWGCGGNSQARMFKSDGVSLRYARDYWISHGRPANFNLEEVFGVTSDFLIYTNIVRSTNGVFHCRFAERRPLYPPGILVITDDGQLIFICNT